MILVIGRRIKVKEILHDNEEWNFLSLSIQILEQIKDMIRVIPIYTIVGHPNRKIWMSSPSGTVIVASVLKSIKHKKNKPLDHEAN